MAFLFRNPTTKKRYQIFLKPLSEQVWISIVFCSVFLVLAQYFGYKFNPRCLMNKKDEFWSLSVVSTFGAFCQQGKFKYSQISGKNNAILRCDNISGFI